jgi:hypothetical protein
VVNKPSNAHLTCTRRLIGRNDLGDDRIDGASLTGAEETPFGAAMRVNSHGLHSRGAAEGKGCRDSDAGLKQRAARVARFHITAVRHVTSSAERNYLRGASSTT